MKGNLNSKHSCSQCIRSIQNNDRYFLRKRERNNSLTKSGKNSKGNDDSKIKNINTYYSIKCSKCQGSFQVNPSEKHYKTLCTGCFNKKILLEKENTFEKKYFLRNTDVIVKNSKCIECKRPYEVKESEKKWKKHCITCWLKLHGETRKCKLCENNILIYEPTGEDMCYKCYLKKAGAKRICILCKGPYYIDSNSKLTKKYCYDCFLKINGIKMKCADCRDEIYVLKEKSSWKKKCLNCYYKN